MNRFPALILILMAIAISGCALAPEQSTPDTEENALQASATLTPFSTNTTSGLPSGWTPMIIFRTKKQTEYSLVPSESKTVLRAYAASASSGLMQHVSIDPFFEPWLNWQWKIGALGGAFTNPAGEMEDAPARIILGFDGDKDKLPFADQILFETAKIITGHDFPYATLMYIWDSKRPIGTVASSARSARIRTMVVANGPAGIGQWRQFNRNIVADFEKAYGEKPGKLIGVGVLTDSDHTGETVEAYYGDIRLMSAPK